MNVFKNKKGQVRSGYLIVVTGFIAIVVITILSALAVFVIAGIRFSSKGFSIEFESPYILSIIQEIGMIIAPLLAWKALNKAKIKSIGFNLRNGLCQLLLGLLFGFLSITLIFIILRILGAASLTNSILQPQFSKYVLFDIVLFIFVGIAEELCFRGYIIGTMRSRGNSKLWCGVVSAVLFSAAHLVNPDVSVIGIINVVLVGILFAYMYLLTGNLWLSTGFHITWNYFQGSIYGFPVSGLETHGLYITQIDSHQWLLNGGKFGPEAGLITTLLVILNLFFLFWWHHKRSNPITHKGCSN